MDYSQPTISKAVDVLAENDRNHYHTLDSVYDDINYTRLREHVQAFYDAMDDHRTR